jgi:hypothetical protein
MRVTGERLSHTMLLTDFRPLSYMLRRLLRDITRVDGMDRRRESADAKRAGPPLRGAAAASRE